MKEFFTSPSFERFRKYPIPFIALFFMWMYFNELSDNREDYRNCQADVKRKDMELEAARERERRTNEQLLNYAFEIRMYREGRSESDSVIKNETKQSVNKILKQ